VLKSGTGHHDAQGDYTYLYLALDEPICVDAPKDAGDDDDATDAPVDRIQIAGDAIHGAPPLGERMRIKGTLFPAHAMWHADAVLIDATTAEPTKLRAAGGGLSACSRGKFRYKAPLTRSGWRLNGRPPVRGWALRPISRCLRSHG
jgi:hypothetical protein